METSPQGRKYFISIYFPDTFIFEGSKDSQYQQVGNAVPPVLSNAIARSLVKALGAEKE